MKVVRDLLLSLQESEDSELLAMESCEEGSLDHAYHDGYSDALYMVIKKIKDLL